MLIKTYNPKTKMDEWVDTGMAHKGYGTSDFHSPHQHQNATLSKETCIKCGELISENQLQIMKQNNIKYCMTCRNKWKRQYSWLKKHMY